MYCWGGGGYGNLGVGQQVSQQTTPRSVSMAGGLTNISITSHHAGEASCAVEAGIVYCVGRNSTGQVGDGTTTTRLLATKVSAGGGMTNNGSVTMVSTRDGHACALENGSAYCWGNAANGRLGNGTTTPNRFVPVAAASLPGAPTIPTVTVGETTATITVSAGSGGIPTSYTVTAQPGGATCVVTPPATGCTIAGLTPGTQYTFTATASNDQGTSPPSAGVIRTTGATAVPDFPRILIGDRTVTVTVSADNGGGTPTGHLVTVGPNGGTCTVMSPATSCTVGGLDNGSTYTVTTEAFNDAGSSNPTAPITVVVGPAESPQQPTVSVGFNSVTVSVSPTTSGGTPAFYTVTAQPGGATCTVSPPATQCVITGLTNGVTYTFTTTATNGGGTSDPGPGVTTLVDLLPVPLAPIVELANDGVTVSVSSDPAGGTVQSHSVYVEPGGHTCTVTPPATQCIITGLVQPTAYTVTTAAINGIGTSDPTPVVPFLFGQPGAPDLTVEAIDQGSVTVRVTPGTPGGPPSSYVVYVDGGSCTITPPATRCTISGLPSASQAPFTTYTATASATNVLGTATNTTGTPVLLEPPAAPDLDPQDVPEVGFQSATVTVSPTTSGAPASSYTVTASAVNQPGDVHTCTVTAPATSCTVTGLTNGQVYEFTAGSSNAYGSSSTSVTTTSALVDVLPIPSTPTVVVGQNTLTVSVSASPSGGSTDSFTVYAEPGGHTCTVAVPTASSCVIPNGGTALVDGQLYTVTTTATNTKGTSQSSPATTALFDPPSTPSVDEVVLGTTSVTVSVTPGPEDTSGPASFFTVVVGPNGGSCMVTPPATTCTVSPLTPNRQYTVTVVATNGKGVSEDSEPAAARLILPSAPPPPVVAVLDGTSVYVLVTPPEPPETPTKYTVVTTTSAGPGPGCVFTPPAVACTLTGLTTDAEYAISTIVTNGYGSSPTGSATTALIAEPATPLEPVLVPGNGQATVTVRPGSGGGEASVFLVSADPDAVSCEVVPPATSCVLAGLTNGVEYTVSVMAGNGVGNSTVSALARVTPEEPRVVLPPGIGNLITSPVPTSPVPTTVPSTLPPTSTTTVPPVRPPTTTVPLQLPPGVVSVLVDDTPVPVEVTAVSPTEVAVTGAGFELRLVAECSASCEVATNPDGEPVIQLEPTGGVRVTGTGFLPGSVAYVWLFSDPRLLGTVTVNADGSFAGVLPVGVLEAGEHTLQVQGTSATGVMRVANLGVVVTEASVPTPGPGRLPATGNGGSSTLLAVAILMMLAGVVVIRRGASETVRNG